MTIISIIGSGQCRTQTGRSRLDHQSCDGVVAKGEPEVQVDLPAREVPLQVVGDVVVVVVELGGAGHLDGVGELARRAGQPRSDLVVAVIGPALVGDRGVGLVAGDRPVEIAGLWAPR